MGARGVSSEHVENKEMFSGSPLRCSPVLQLRKDDKRIFLRAQYQITSKQGFYQTDDSKVIRRLLKEKSKFTFVDV